MHGFLLIDKAKGGTSFSCVRELRKITGVKRMGFLGTLDPLATGLLVFAIGEATKLIPYLEGLDKVYEVAIRLGGTSTTYDAEGEITETLELTENKKPSRSLIEKTLEEDFLGERMQIPPIYSAIKVEGKRAYSLARKNVPVELKPRKVTFHDLQLKSYAWPLLRVMVHCGSGTYVRTFAHDLGKKLGCGGYVEELRRTKIGSFKIQDATGIDTLTPLNFHKYLIPPEELLHDWTHLNLTDDQYQILANGNFIENISQRTKGPILALYKGQCVGVIEVHESGKLKFERKFNRV